jgi:hypothetical protein
VTSGYCPRYRYTLIATLTLANLYYICVDFLPTHTIGESVLPAHFLRALIRRSFHVDSFSFMWIVRFGRCSLDHSFVRGVVRAGIIRWVIFVARLCVGVIRWVILCWFSCGSFIRWVIIWFRSFRCGIFSLASLWASLPFRWLYVGVFALFVSCRVVFFMWIRSEDLGRGVLEGNFCTVESL